MAQRQDGAGAHLLLLTLLARARSTFGTSR